MTEGVGSRRGTGSHLLRAALLLGAAAIFALLLFLPAFRADDGWLTADTVVPCAGACALVLLALAAGSPFRRAALFTGLALLGAAAVCRLTLAGTPVRYQHFRPFDTGGGFGRLALAVLAVQTLIVAVELRGRLGAIAALLRATLRPWQAALLLAAWFVCGAAPSEDYRAFAIELVLAFLVALVQAATLALAAGSLPKSARAALARAADRLLGPDEESTDGPVTAPRLDAFAWRTALLVLVTTAVLAFFVWERHPHVQDEVKYLLHARYLAAGKLGMTPPPVPEAFEMFLLEIGPHGWYAVTPPGWPLALAVGEWFHAAWLVNPVLAGLDVLLVYLLLQELHDRRTARLGTLLFALSPWSLLLGMTYMSHHLTLAGALVGALGVAWTRRTGHARWAWIGGLALGVVLATRQLDGAVAALLCGLWAIGLGGKRLHVAGIVGLVLGAVVVTVGLLIYNTAYTGDPRVFPIMAHCDRLFGPGANAYGFGPDRGMDWPLDPGGKGHGPRDALINGALNTFATQVELFGWACGSLVPVFLNIVKGRWSRSDRLHFSVLALVYVAYFFNYFSGGPDFGARYWFLMIVPAAALTATALRRLGRGPVSTVAGAEPLGEPRTLAFAAAATLVALLVFLPWRCLDKYHDFRGMRPGVADLAGPEGYGHALVLVRGKEIPDWGSACIENPLDVTTGETVYAWDRSLELRRRLVAAYPDRRFYLVDGPSRTKGEFRLVAGPLTGPELLARRFGP